MIHQTQPDTKQSGRVVQPYDAKELGAPFTVLLLDGFHTEQDEAGRTLTCIEDLPGLLAAVVRSRVLHPCKLSGDDLRFIRSAMCMKSHEIAAHLDLSPEHYSRCETGPKAMSAATEKLYRMFVFFTMVARDRDFDALVAEKKKDIELTKEEAQKSIAAFKKIFFDMKLSSVRKVGEELCFAFCRRCCPGAMPCGNDNGEWRDRATEVAA